MRHRFARRIKARGSQRNDSVLNLSESWRITLFLLSTFFRYQFKIISILPKIGLLLDTLCCPGKSMPPRQFRKLSFKQKKKIAKQLAAFLRELHNFPVALARKCGVIDAWSEGDARKYYDENATYAYKKLNKKDSLLLKNLIHQYDKEYRFKPTVAHQDLTWDNILISNNKTVTGIIDFGDIQITDPAGDIGRLTEYGIDFMDLVIKYYRPTEKNLEIVHLKCTFV